jgi:hypothetical protein
LLVGLPATAALAAQPATAPEAQAKAQHHRERAAFYRSLGGVGYKTGQVQRAEADAARYDALAARLAAPPIIVLPSSPEAEHYAKLAARYRAMGGAAYKTGQVQWAEAQQRKHEGAAAGAAVNEPASYKPAAFCLATKPAVILACNR